ncbi:uncharacterized protein LOC131163659 isoform X3 [Malania oleifera]|uniref:uncharacterized protein LOC131163659 isoform X3 n=1 Tax=Malania oleifera TaxID=397392 RepID=UPI0025AE15C3|nr:uncharacterized protein LOC131163659 isoform X3 [Malania oleifera]
MAVGQQAAAEAAKSSLSIFCVTLLLISTQLLIQSPTVLAAPPALVSSQQSISSHFGIQVKKEGRHRQHYALKDNEGTCSASNGCGALDTLGPGKSYNEGRKRVCCPSNNEQRHP